MKEIIAGDTRRALPADFAFHHHGVRHGRLHAELVALAIVGRIGLVLYAVATDGNEKVMHAAAREARTARGGIAVRKGEEDGGGPHDWERKS